LKFGYTECYGTVDNSSQKIINGNKLGPLNVVALSKQKGGPPPPSALPASD